MTVCTVCGEALHLGDWPYCPHESTRSSYAQHFEPIVLHQNPDGSYSFPASTSASIKPGSRKVEIRTIQEADRITREVNAREDTILAAVNHQTSTNRSETRKMNRALMDHIRAGGAWVAKDEHGREVVRHGLSKEAQQYMDRAREYVALKDRERDNNRPRSTNFHMEVFANDSSNRDSHTDERTQWKSRKA